MTTFRRYLLATLGFSPALFAMTGSAAPPTAAAPTATAVSAAPATPQSKRTLDAVRKKYWLDDLPEKIAIPTGADGSLVVTKHLIDASVDDIAFATAALQNEATALYRMASDLKRIHDLARQAGAVGTANAVTAVIKADGGAK